MPQQEWVPTSSGVVPAGLFDVLLTRHGMDDESQRWIGWGHYNAADGRWYDASGYVLRRGEVAAWMPLPAVYRASAGELAQELTDAARWRFFRSRALCGVDEGANLYLGMYAEDEVVGDDGVSAAAGKLQILTRDERDQLLGAVPGAVGYLQGGAVVDRVIDHAEGVVRATRPEVVCLCGSSRFVAEMAMIAWGLEKEGKIVLSLHLLPADYPGVAADHQAEAEGVAAHMDALHLRKIDLADRVLVVNVHGYIGDSTRNEIRYAVRAEKPVVYLEPVHRSGY